MIKNFIVFTGFMGSGKTTMSNIVSDFYNFPLKSIDNEIESSEGILIKDIFAKFGEKYFRDLESAKLFEIITNNNIAVVDLGGGAFIQERNRKILKDNNIISIFLNPSFETICRRLENERDCRPMLKKENWISEAKKLFEYRYSFYSQADLIIDVKNDDNVNTVFENIKRKL